MSGSIQKTRQGVRRVRIGRLTTAADCKRLIARCIKRAAADKKDATNQYRLVNMTAILLKAIESSEFEERIESLEVLHNGAKPADFEAVTSDKG